MASQQPIRVPHLRRSFIAAKVGFVCGAIILSASGFFLCSSAQASPCSLSGIRQSAQFSYPMMAHVAHVYGDVTLDASFDPSGTPNVVAANNGPVMLRSFAKSYVESWRVNETPNGQTCPITISFKMEGIESCDVEPSSVLMTDTQHFTVSVRPIQTCDPSGAISMTRHRFLFIHWTTKS